MSEFLSSPFFIILFSLVVSLVTVVAGGQLALWFLKKKQGYPSEEAIEKALRPYAINAIIAAYKVSEAQADALGERLHGIDKLLVAMKIYELLPDKIVLPLPGGETLKLPISFVKQLVSEEDFANIIEAVFGELEDFLESTQGKFGKEVEKLLGELA